MLRILTPKTRAADGKILPKTVQDIERVESQLADARTRLAEAIAERDDQSLAAVLSGDSWPAHGAVQKVRDAQDSVAVFEAALEAAKAAEQDRLRAARAAARQSAIRAARQHLGSLKRELIVAEAAYANLVKSYARCLEIAETTRRVLPQDTDFVDFGRHLAAPRIAEEFKTELNRVSGLQFGNPALHPLNSAKLAPGAMWPTWFQPEDVAPLAERFFGKLIGYFNALVGTPSPPKSEPVASVEPPVEVASAAVEPPIAPKTQPFGPTANVYAGIVAEREQAIADLAGPTDAGNNVIHLDEPLDFTGATDTRRLTLETPNG